MSRAYDIILTNPKVLSEDIQVYIDLIKPIFPKFIIAKEYGTEEGGLHYHCAIYADVKKDTIKTRLKEVLDPKIFLRSRNQKKITDHLKLLAYTIKDGDYVLVGDHDLEELEKAKAISFPKSSIKPKTFKAFKQEIENKYMDGEITLYQANELYTEYNLDNVEEAIQQQQRDYYFQRIILKKDKDLRKMYNEQEYNKQLKWINKLKDTDVKTEETISSREQRNRMHEELEGIVQYYKYPL